MALNYSLDVSAGEDLQNLSLSMFNNCLPADPTPHSGNYRTYRLTIEVFVVGVLCLVGFLGNALSIAVLRRDRDRKNMTNWLLQTLALADTLYLVTCLFYQTLKGINDYTTWWPWLKIAMPYMEPFIWPCASIAQTLTVWLILLVTIDRYIAVCKPLATNLRTLPRAKVAAAGLFIMAIIYNLPRFFERRFEFKYNNCTGLYDMTSVKTALRENSYYFLGYKTLAYFIFRAIGPLVTLIILNFKLIRALQKVQERHRNLTKKTSNSRKQENITLVLIVVVSVFIVCVIPDMLLRILFTIKSYTSLDFDVEKLRYINTVTNMLLTVNSSINFLIYCLTGHKFRKILCDMCCREKALIAEASESEPLTSKSTCISKVQHTESKQKTHEDVCL